MPVSESSPAIKKILLVLTFKQPTCHPCLPHSAIRERKVSRIKKPELRQPLPSKCSMVFPNFPFLPPSLATWSGFSGRKIPAVLSLIAISYLFSVSSYLVVRSVTRLYSLNSFQCWLSDLRGVDLSSVRTKSQVVTPILM